MKSGSGVDDFMHWETALPDYWVPRGYVQIRCDQRGSGASAGKLDVLGPQVQRDFIDAIEWAGTQPWSNGRVGLLGDSYFAALQWLVAQHRPRHLKAIAPVQGFTDFYRDALRHGGMLSARFLDLWFEARVRQWQFGSPRLDSASALPAQQLAANTVWDRDFRQLLRDEKLATSAFAAERTPDLARIDVPVYAYANSGGLGLHGRGTIDGFCGAVHAPMRKLKIGVGPDPDTMYTLSEVQAQQRFFDRHLKGIHNGIENEPRVTVAVRRGADVIERQGNDYPLPGTRALRWFIDPARKSIGAAPATAGAASYRSEYGRSDEPAMLRVVSAPLAADLELIGPLRLRLRIACTAPDADLYVALREWRADGSEVTAQGAQDPALPVAMGWLRASMRKTDPLRSTAYRAWHTYDERQPLTPGVAVEVDVNLWPTAWILQRGHRLVLEISGSEQAGMVTFAHPPRGPWRPNAAQPVDNGGAPPCEVTVLQDVLHDNSAASYLVLPVHTPGAGAERLARALEQTSTNL